MHILLINEGGRVEEALMLGSTGNRMRVMLRGCEDAQELQRVAGIWLKESGAKVEIGALIPEPRRKQPAPAAPVVRPRVFTAGAQFGQGSAN